MSIVQFLRVIWAHRLLILVFTVVCFTAATVIVNVVTPRYQAETRVMLDVIKPDPVTGEVISSAFLRAYTKSQTEMVKNPDVARQVVRDLGWANDPKLQRAYRDRKGSPDMDFTHWAAQQITDGANADLIMGSNILEITYNSYSPERAKRVADGLREAYMDMTLQQRRETARRNAEWYETQAQQLRNNLFKAEGDKATFERDNGILLQDDKIDLDSARLSALASAAGGAQVMAAPMAGNSASAAQLATLDADIAEQTKILGPNHPQLQQMKARRAILATQVAQERNTASSSAGASMSAARATAGMLEQQKAKVMGQRDKVEKLRLMQDEIDLRRDQYNKAITRAAQLRQETEATEAGITTLAPAITPQAPVFPNKPLIIGAALPLGAGMGVMLALMMELFGRRVRSAEDLHAAVDAPVLAVFRNAREKPVKGGRLRVPRRPMWRSTPKVARS